MLLRLSTLALAASLLSTQHFVRALSAQDIPSDTPVSSLLSSAQSHLSRGETSQALLYYDAAVAKDPTNYLTFFKRATTYLSLGRTSQATEDFRKVLSLKPGFEGAHIQLAKIRSRSADWEGAKSEYAAANRGLGSTEYSQLEEAEGAAILAETSAKNGMWEDCINNAGVAILTANRAVSLRELRSRCRFERGEIEEGMSDLQHVLQMKPGDIAPHLKIAATTFYGLGDRANGMAQTRKCLHSDPDSKPCKKLLKTQKSIDKTLTKVTKAFEKGQPMTGVKMLIESSDEPGLIGEIKDQVTELRESQTIPEKAPNLLYTRVVEMACQGYYDVSYLALVVPRRPIGIANMCECR
jgi:DnaJ homolog subfamily C member 3